MYKCCIYLIKEERRRGGRVNRPRLQNPCYDRNKLLVAVFSTKIILKKMPYQVEGDSKQDISENPHRRENKT